MTFREFFEKKYPDIGWVDQAHDSASHVWWGDCGERYDVALTRLIDTLIEFIDSRPDDKDDRSAV